ncbi:MAG: ATPase, T2SS/T4P/T4SS family [Candidatus Hodarchaeales archaeon]|jgi:type IV secretory pathway ATPase VirB11/archaellum biosynthesis ATPase
MAEETVTFDYVKANQEGLNPIKSINLDKTNSKEYNISHSKGKLVDSYRFYGYTANIFQRGEKIEYSFDFTLDFFPKFQNLHSMAVKAKKRMSQKNIEKILKFNDVITLLQEVLGEVKAVKKNDENGSTLVLAILFHLIGLKKIGPLLLDPKIDEIYYVPRAAKIYVDHSRWGRCITSLKLEKGELNALINRVKIENELTLTRFNPSMKGEIATDFFHIRVTLDIPPLSIEGVSFNIRKLRKNRFPLHALCLNDTLSFETAAFLIFCLTCGSNLTVFGPPSSGKTTLVTAVMEYLPFSWRLISIEDVIETFSEHPVNQIKFKVDPFEKEVKVKTKEDEVIKLLHRSPDFLNLGEISTRDHSKAFFQALASGIPSMQTIHGRDIDGLILRFEEVFNIPRKVIQFSAPHVLVHIDSLWVGTKKIRRVLNIYEVMRAKDEKDEEKLFITTIASYDPIAEKMIVNKAFSSTFVMRHFASQRGISIEQCNQKYEMLLNRFLSAKTNVFDTTFLLGSK